MAGNTPNKFSFPGNSIYENTNGIQLFYFGKVVSNTDEFDGQRIKVRIKGIDDHIDNDNLSFAFPILPKHINIVPNVGETAIIQIQNTANPFENRLYFGPVISQPHKLNNDPHYYSSRALLAGGFIDPDQAPSKLPEAKGIYPSIEEISIQGRVNTDIRLKRNEVLIRAGKFEEGNSLKFNKTNPSYIQLKYGVNLNSDNTNEVKRGSVTNIVASKINLLTHDGGSPRFKLTNQDNLISDEELSKILTEAHPIAKGDVIEEFFALIKEFVQSHVHAYHGDAPDQTKNIQDILNFDLSRISSENIRIN